MDYLISVSDSRKFVKIKYLKDITNEIFIKSVADTNEAGKKYKIERLLTDVREVKNVDTTKHNYVSAFKSLPSPDEHQYKKVALVADPMDNSHSMLTAFIEMRGFRCKEFLTEEEAVKWLEIDHI
ncbi:MAG: hypothetical protein GXX85_08690 [Ignavibacteria bacterium]|nr:hypothetical protein [Ignavibacteria bacterium]